MYNTVTMSLYMKVLILAVAFPFALSFYPPFRFYKHLRALLLTLLLILLLFGSWDVFAAFRGHWYFNPADVWPARVVNLPLEEVLFFICIPFACIFTWEAINYFSDRRS